MRTRVLLVGFGNIWEIIERLRTFEKNNDLRIIVKPHPVDDSKALKTICSVISEDIILIDNNVGVHNHELLTISSLFISSVSSMFTEAISANCLPISYWNEEINYLYEVERRDVWSNLAVTVETLDDLEATCIRALSYPEWCGKGKIKAMRKMLPNYIGTFDGKNAWRAASEGLWSALETANSKRFAQLKASIELDSKPD